jgi:hypothetical protein
MKYFCTLFDSFYLNRGLVMYKSLEAHCKDFHLYIFAFDDVSLKILRAFNLKHATIVSLGEFENEKLLAVKGGRGRGEYCWTCTSSTIDYCLTNFNLPHCTYLDADLCFYGEPGILIDEMAGKSVLITEHRYTSTTEWLAKAGIYCVQFITFYNNEDGRRVLHWWRDRCIEWCFARFEDGKFGDQKYLDDWLTRFPGVVHVLQHIGGGVAPWNVQQYTLTRENGRWSIAPRNGGEKQPLVFFHFHYLKFYDDRTVDLSHEYTLGDRGVLELYQDYVKEIIDVNSELETRFNLETRVEKRVNKIPLYAIGRRLYHRFRRLKGYYNVIDRDAFAAGRSY